MDWLDRLRRMVATEHTPDVALRPPLAPASEPPLEELVAGQWVQTRGGRCYVAEQTTPLSQAHGRQTLGDLGTIPASVWQPFLAAADGFDPRDAVFLDTETTGLARAAGTYCFLVGLGYFSGETFVVRQYMMPDFGEEEALLDLVAAELGARTGLISFNGRSFDWPLIETRYVLARRPPPHTGEPHLDLLPVARRLWRRVLDSCALGALEQHVLGVERSDEDVPGYMIPQLYLDYVQRGRTRPIANIFYHNATDILSMVTLAARMGHILQEPFASKAGRDWLALGRMYVAQERADEALRAYVAAVEQGRADELPIARREMSFLLKRLGRLDEAMDLWWAELEGAAVYPYIELAKAYEHRLRDPGRARRLVQRALERVTRGDLRDPHASTLELMHRLCRLEARLAHGSAGCTDEAEGVDGGEGAPGADAPYAGGGDQA